MRILLSLAMVLSGLLMAREFTAPAKEHLRLTLRGAKVVSEQSIATVHEPPALVAPMTECEQIWDQVTHMTRKEWAEACRRVDDENRAGDK